jgi:hypothetical protein
LCSHTSQHHTPRIDRLACIMCILRGVLNTFGGNRYNNDQSPWQKLMEERRQIVHSSKCRLAGNAVPKLGKNTAELIFRFFLLRKPLVSTQYDGEHLLGAYLNGCAATRSSAWPSRIFCSEHPLIVVQLTTSSRSGACRQGTLYPLFRQLFGLEFPQR